MTTPTVRIEPISDDYERVVYDADFSLIVRRKNKYINATQLCILSGKAFFHWKANKKSKTLLNTISNKLSIAKNELLITVAGGQDMSIRGTYVHPDLLIHIATWISDSFAIKIADIVKQWRGLSHENDAEYWRSMSHCIVNEANSNDNQEARIRDALAVALNGSTEVESKNGIIDIITDREIIEVKHLSDWKHALGQVLAYSRDARYREHARRIHLYYGGDSDIVDDIIMTSELRYNIEEACGDFDCVVTFEQY